MRCLALLSAVLTTCALMASPSLRQARADVTSVAPGASLQAAIDAAQNGDVLQLAEGEYPGDIDFDGKALTIRGVGRKTVLRGTGTGSVVRFESGEGESSILDSVLIRGGRAVQGGGVRIFRADPVIVRCVVMRNRASSQGSGIWVGGGGEPLLFNNLVIYNRRDGGDPHGIEVVDAAPRIVNNTVCRHDSNGLVLRGNSPAVVLNNVFAYNGARIGKSLRGRGICDFTSGGVLLRGNLFHRNRVAAILHSGRDWGRITRLERDAPDPLVTGNRDGSPGFKRAPPASSRRARIGQFSLRRKSRARDAGVEGINCTDADRSRNDIGHTGGPYAGDAIAVPDGNACALP